jgi:predicted esterase YcpF (UPF0227 family)
MLKDVGANEMKDREISVMEAVRLLNQTMAPFRALQEYVNQVTLPVRVMNYLLRRQLPKLPEIKISELPNMSATRRIAILEAKVDAMRGLLEELLEEKRITEEEERTLRKKLEELEKELNYYR